MPDVTSYSISFLLLGVQERQTSPALVHQDINCGNLLTSAVGHQASLSSLGNADFADMF